MQFDVQVTRIAYAVKTIRVEADGPDEARQKALEEAGNHLFTEHNSDYEAEPGFPVINK